MSRAWMGRSRLRALTGSSRRRAPWAAHPGPLPRSSLACGVRVLAALWLAIVVGCHHPPRQPGLCPNPVMIPRGNPDHIWDNLVNVVDDYFTIDREKRIQVVGDVLTEGRLDTFPKIGGTLLEPWEHDPADGYERLEGTLQTIRRRAVVRAIPAPEGYLLDVVVYKELEDLVRPEHATAGAAAFRHDHTPDRFVEPVGGQQAVGGWIPLGRDTALEQLMLADLQAAILGPPPGYRPGLLERLHGIRPTEGDPAATSAIIPEQSSAGPWLGAVPDAQPSPPEFRR